LLDREALFCWCRVHVSGEIARSYTECVSPAGNPLYVLVRTPEANNDQSAS